MFELEKIEFKLHPTFYKIMKLINDLNISWALLSICYSKKNDKISYYKIEIKIKRFLKRKYNNLKKIKKCWIEKIKKFTHLIK